MCSSSPVTSTRRCPSCCGTAPTIRCSRTRRCPASSCYGPSGPGSCRAAPSATRGCDVSGPLQGSRREPASGGGQGVLLEQRERELPPGGGDARILVADDLEQPDE